MSQIIYQPDGSILIEADAFVTTRSQIQAFAKQGVAPFSVYSNTFVANLNVEFLNGQPFEYYLDYNNFTNLPILTFAELGDTNITAPQNYDILYYDSNNSEWINLNIGEAGEVLTANSQGQLEWQAPAGAGLISNAGTGGANRVTYWTDASTIGGDASLTWDGSDLTVGGNVGIGVTPTAKLHVTNTGSGDSFLVEDSANPDSDPFVITSLGNIVKGHTTNVGGYHHPQSETDATPATQIHGDASTKAQIALTSWSASDPSYYAPAITLAKSSSATVGTKASGLVSGEDLGSLVWSGDDGTSFVKAAMIQAEIDGTPGVSDMPGRLTFSTTAAGSATPTERMRIQSDGDVGIGTINPDNKLHVAGSISLDAYLSGTPGKGIFFRDGFNESTSPFNLAILTHDFNGEASGNTSPDALMLTGFDGVAIHTGSNTYDAANIRILAQQDGDVNILGNTKIGGTAGQTPSAALEVVGDIFPGTNSTYDLGSTSLRWNTVYANTVYAIGGLIAGDTSDYPDYEMLLDFGAAVANTWTKIVAIASPNIDYSTIGFKIEITNAKANHATIVGIDNIINETYYVACIRTLSTTANNPDACEVRGPSDTVRAIKTSQGNYEIQVQNDGQYREYRIRISVYASNGSHTVTYFKGGTAGTATATYTASIASNVNSGDYFQNVRANGIVTIGAAAIVNDTAARTYTTGTIPKIQLNAAGAAQYGISRWSADTNSNAFLFLKSRGATIGTYSLVSNDDELGKIAWYGANTTSGVLAAQILAAVDGTPSGTGTDMPGRLVFSTTPDGSGSVVERMRIKSDGDINILNDVKIGGSAGDTPLEKLHVSGTGQTILVTPVTYASNQNSPYLIVAATSYDGVTSNWGAYGFQHRLKSNSGGTGRITVDIYNGEVFSIDNAGVVVVGGAESQTVGDNTGLNIVPQLQVHGTTQATSSLTLANWSSTGSDESLLIFTRSKSGTVGTKTSLANDDNIGSITFSSPNVAGTAWGAAAQIFGEVDGTPSTYAPGRLAFFTNGGGAAAGTERMRITSDGFVGINTTSPKEYLDVRGEIVTDLNRFIGGNLYFDNGATAFKFIGATGYGAYMKLSDNNNNFNIWGTTTDAATAGGAGSVVTTQNLATYEHDNDNWLFYTAGSERMRITSDGHIAIGTTTPDSKYFIHMSNVDSSGVGTANGNGTRGLYLYTQTTGGNEDFVSNITKTGLESFLDNNVDSTRTISSISSDGSYITVQLDSAHNFIAGDAIYITGTNNYDGSYVDIFDIPVSPPNSFRIASTLNVATETVGEVTNYESGHRFYARGAVNTSYGRYGQFETAGSYNQGVALNVKGYFNNVYGSYNLARADQQSPAIVGNLYGSFSDAQIYDTGKVSSAVGAYNRIYKSLSSTDTTYTGTAWGSRNEVLNYGGTITTAIGVGSEIDNRTGNTVTTAIFFYGDQTGGGTYTNPVVGIYTVDSDTNYLNGDLVIGDSVKIGQGSAPGYTNIPVPSAALEVVGTAIATTSFRSDIFQGDQYFSDSFLDFDQDSAAPQRAAAGTGTNSTQLSSIAGLTITLDTNNNDTVPFTIAHNNSTPASATSLWQLSPADHSVTQYPNTNTRWSSTYVIYGQSTGASMITLGPEGTGDNEISVNQAEGINMFVAKIAGIRTDNTAGIAFELRGAIQYTTSGTATAIVGTVSKDTITSFGTVTSVDVQAIADDTNETLLIQAKSGGSYTMNWTATVELIHVGTT